MAGGIKTLLDLFNLYIWKDDLRALVLRADHNADVADADADADHVLSQ